MTGSGTELDPYIIEDVQDLQDIQLHPAAWYELGGDIDAFETASWNMGEYHYLGFIPISAFTGNFDGKGHIIDGLYINRSLEAGSDYVGLFRGLANASAKIVDVHLTHLTVIANNFVGGMVGQITLGTVEDCTVEGNVSGNWYIGLFVGLMNGYGASISRCGATGSVMGANVVGGFVGDITNSSSIVDSSAYVNTLAASEGYFHFMVGGFAGQLSYGAEIQRSYALGDVNGSHYGVYRTCVGGFVGRVIEANHTNCFARGIVLGYNGYQGGIYAYVGGFCGYIYSYVNGYSYITNCYSTGLVAGETGGGQKFGGLVGYEEGIHVYAPGSLWDMETSGQLTSALGTGKTTEEMKTESTFTDQGWDFVTIWLIDPDINDGYPFFLGQAYPLMPLPPLLTIEYSSLTPPLPPKLTIEHEAGIPAMPPKLTIEHEYLAPIAPKLTIEHEAEIIPMAPKLTIEHEAAVTPMAPKLTIEYVKPTIPEDVSPGIQIYISEAWVDISQYVMSAHIKRGRMHELDRVEAGTIILVIDNQDGAFWRYNADSPFYGYIKPLLRIRVVMALGDVEYSLFNGVIEAWKPSWMGDITGGLPIMNVEGVDMFKRFSRAYIREERAAELPGQRINAVLNHIGWPSGEGWRSIDPGTIMISALEYDQANPANALEHMLDVAQAEGGILFMDGEGKVVFQDCDARITGEYSVMRATLTKDDFLPVKLSDDDAMIFNSAQVNNQLFEIPDIDPIVGSREYKETLPIASESDALARAYIIAQRYKESILRLPAIPILPANNPGRLYPMIYGYELSTRIMVELDDLQYPATLEENYHIEGIQHWWDARSKLWKTEWQVWEVSQFRLAGLVHLAWAMCHRIIYQSIPGYVGVWPHPGYLAPYNDDAYIEVGQFSGLQDIWISRGLVEFDTSGVNADVIEAHVFLCFHSTTQGALDRAIKVTLVNPGSVEYPMQTGDYGVLGTKDQILGESAEFDTAHDGDWIDIPLNAAGIYHIQKGGITRFGLRTNHDINADDDDLVNGTIKLENCRFCGVGTGKEPYLIAKLDI